jgi:hypothetical protein
MNLNDILKFSFFPFGDTNFMSKYPSAMLHSGSIFRTTLLWLLSEIVMFPVSSKFYKEQSKSPDIIDDTYTSNRRQREWISELIL